MGRRKPHLSRMPMLALGIMLVLAACSGGGQATPTAVRGVPAGSNRAAPTDPPASPVSGVEVFIDPGHGGIDEGTFGTTTDGRQVAEKTVALAIALKTAALLQADGYRVVLSRSDDSLPGLQPGDLTPDGLALTPQGVLNDLQRRIDRANASGARLLLSIHLNSFDDPSVGGAETYYDSDRPFAAQNRRLADLVQTNVIDALRSAGYITPDRGVWSDSDLQTESLGVLPSSYNHLVLLGPALPGYVRPSEMPGVLSEPLFLSDPSEATAAADPSVQSLLARAYAGAIEAFLRGGS